MHPAARRSGLAIVRRFGNAALRIGASQVQAVARNGQSSGGIGDGLARPQVSDWSVTLWGDDLSGLTLQRGTAVTLEMADTELDLQVRARWDIESTGNTVLDLEEVPPA